MAVLDTTKTLQNLKSKGFLVSNSHHKFLEFWHNGKLILHTKISHGSADLDDYLIRKMSQQCKLSRKDFVDLAKCPLSMEQYIEKLKLGGNL